MACAVVDLWAGGRAHTHTHTCTTHTHTHTHTHDLHRVTAAFSGVPCGGLEVGALREVANVSTATHPSGRKSWWRCAPTTFVQLQCDTSDCHAMHTHTFSNVFKVETRSRFHKTLLPSIPALRVDPDPFSPEDSANTATI
jgi:hypothetical protein